MMSENAGASHETSPVAACEEFLKITEHTGLDYLSALADLHRRLAPKTYIEIGTLSGGTLALAHCPSVAIDPKFLIDRDVIGAKPTCFFFQMTSDDFFANHDPQAVLGAPVQLAFLDGMHLFEFLLRDFANTEKSCDKSSIILMHDCLPPDSYVGRRDWRDKKFAHVTKYPDWWAGDVWKTVYILQKWRPDLEIYGLNSPPTGLIAVTNLDPGSRTLARHYDELVGEYQSIHLHSCADAYMQRMNMIDTKQFIESALVAKLICP
jgi:hypothetical protein